MKNSHRVLVASQKEAKLFNYEKGHNFKLIHYYNDEAFSNEIQFTGPPGRSNKRMQRLTYALNRDNSQKENLRHHFIHMLSHKIYEDKKENHFESLSLIAESKTLGDLRKFLHKSLKSLVTEEICLNLVGLPENEIIDHLKKTCHIGFSNCRPAL